MFSSNLRKMCPYLTKGASRTEAAMTSSSLPEALKSCPYVKDLYSGFESSETNQTFENTVSRSAVGNMVRSSVAEAKPKLFKMEEAMVSCPCRDKYGLDCNFEKHVWDQETSSFSNIAENGIAEDDSTNLYDSKFDTAIHTLKDEGRYRKFINVQRHKGQFPVATRREDSSK